MHAAGELDSNGAWSDTDSDGYFDVFVWLKNVGAETIDDIPRCDILISGNNTVWNLIPHSTYASGGYPQWSYTIENGTEWSQATTIRVEIIYESALSTGEYRIKALIPNGISDDIYFSM